jgi:uncharacterized protein (DUF302 family)
MQDLIHVACEGSVPDITDRLVKLIEANGLHVFLRLDHAANAKGVGMVLRPTILLIFGNPRGGTPLMQEAQTAGLDLPFKLLVWEDAQAKAWVTYGDPESLIERHGLSPASLGTIDIIKSGVAKMVQAVAKA